MRTPDVLPATNFQNPREARKEYLFPTYKLVRDVSTDPCMGCGWAISVSNLKSLSLLKFVYPLEISGMTSTGNNSFLVKCPLSM